MLRLCQVSFRQMISFEILSVTGEVTVNLLFLLLSCTQSWACSELSSLPVPRVRVWGLGRAPQLPGARVLLCRQRGLCAAVFAGESFTLSPEVGERRFVEQGGNHAKDEQLTL